MRWIIVIPICLLGFSEAKAQFPGTDSLRNYNITWITNNASRAFTNYRLHTLLAGMIDWIDSARTGGGGTLGIDSIAALNDSTLRYRINGSFRTFTYKGVYDARRKVDTLYKVNDTTIAFRVNDNLRTFTLPGRVNFVDSVYRKAGQDSIFYRKEGVEFAIKDSTGGSGNAIAGSGYRWLLPGTQEIKTFFAGWGIGIDSSSNTNGLTARVDSSVVSSKAWRQKGDDSVAAVLRQVIIDSAADIRADFPSGGSGSSVSVDSATLHLSINNAGDSTITGIDSWGQGQGASSSAHYFVNIFGARINNAITNISFGGRGIVHATVAYQQTLRGTRNRRNVLIQSSINDPRRGGGQYRTLRKVQYGMQGIAVATFLSTAVGVSDASVTKTGTWTGQNLAASGSRAGNGDVSGTPMYTVASGAQLTYTSNGDNIAVGVRVSDSVNRTYGRILVRADGDTLGFYNLNAYTDGISDGGWDNRTMFTALYFFGLGTGNHTIEVITQSTDSVFVDYIGTLMRANECPPVYIGLTPKLPTASYAINTGDGDTNGSDAVFNQVDSAIRVMVMGLRRFGYPIAAVDVNTSFFHTTAEMDTDGLHPSDIGHAHLADAYSKTMGLGIKQALAMRQGTITHEFRRDGFLKLGALTANTTDYAGFGAFGTNPGLYFNQPAGAANTKYWDFFVNGTGDRMQWRILNDALTTPAVWMDIMRTAGAVTSISTAATTFAHTGNMTVSGTFVAGSTVTGTTFNSDGTVAGYNYDNRTNGAFAGSLYSPQGDTRLFVGGADRWTLTTAGFVGIGTTSPDRNDHVEIADAGTNSIVYTRRNTHVTSATAVAGFGVGEEDELENGSGSNFVGRIRDSRLITPTALGEDVDEVLSLRGTGSTREVFRVIGSTGSGRFLGGLSLGSVSNGTAGTDSLLTISGTNVRKIAPGTYVTSNLYSANGALAGNRTVTFGANDLIYDATSTGQFKINGLRPAITGYRLVVKNTDSALATIAASTFATQSALNDTAAAIRSAIGGGGGLSGSGTSGRVAYWNGGSSLTSDANFTYASTLGGTLSVGGGAGTAHLNIAGDKNISSNDLALTVAAATYTDIVTSASSTAGQSWGAIYFGAPTIAAQNASVTVNSPTTLTIEQPVAGTNVTFGTPAYAVLVNGTMKTAGSVFRSFGPQASGTTVTTQMDIIACSAASGAYTITLPSAANLHGVTFTFKRTDNSGNSCTVNTTSSQTIDGSTTYSLTAQFKYVTVTSDGSNWLIIANN